MATVQSVTETAVSATVDGIKPLLAVCKFTFKEKNTNTGIPVKELSIGYGENASDGYPQSATVTPSVTTPGDVTLDAPYDQSSWSLLTLNLKEETSDGVYVSLLPVASQSDFYFSVTNSKGTYTGTASATLKAGRFYRVELTLE